MQNYVFVLDTNKAPQNPVRPAEARLLLTQKKAAVYKRFPFTIILKAAMPEVEPAPVQLKVDPGSKTTGMVLVQDGKVVWAAELTHRGQAIKDALQARRAIRRGRRNRHTRYRQARFANRTRPKGWLPPSLKSRIDNLETWFVRLFKLCNLTAISMELVRFDTQLMQDAEVSGVEYQQGELQGYEVREYLLEKFGRKCCYCGAMDVALEIEHIIARSRGGSNRVSNLCTACHKCNQDKGNQTVQEFLKNKPEALKRVLAQAKAPLKDAAAVNSARWATWRMFERTGLPVEVGTGGRTKFNRIGQAYPKAHWIDAACVGESGTPVQLSPGHHPLLIKAMGRGTRQMCRMDKYGFPRTSAKAAKRVFGFQTGDLVKTIVPDGKRQGTHIGRVAVRAIGSFRVGKIDGIAHRHCQLIQRVDGYDYLSPSPVRLAAIPPTAKADGFPAGGS